MAFEERLREVGEIVWALLAGNGAAVGIEYAKGKRITWRGIVGRAAALPALCMATPGVLDMLHMAGDGRLMAATLIGALGWSGIATVLDRYIDHLAPPERSNRR